MGCAAHNSNTVGVVMPENHEWVRNLTKEQCEQLLLRPMPRDLKRKVQRRLRGFK